MESLDDLRAERLGAALETLVEEAVAAFAAEDVAAETVSLLRLAEARYVGQGGTLSVPFGAPVDASTSDAIAHAFHALHRQQYGFDQPSEAVEVVNLRLVATGQVEKPPLVEEDLDSAECAAAEIGRRDVVFRGSLLATTLYDRELLRPGNALHGPAIVHQVDSTTVVPPGHMLEVDGYRNLVITPCESS
jgi:N-methylhydantoinase A